MEILKKIILFKLRNIVSPRNVPLLRLFNPAVLVYMWAVIAVIAQLTGDYATILLAACMILFAYIYAPVLFSAMLGRTRWILVSVCLIYVYTSPGQALWPQLGVFSPVSSGMVEGSLQLLRIISVLAGLSVLLAVQTQAQLIAGLYTLSFPLRILGLSRSHMAVRLALTLRYADVALQNKAGNWQRNLALLFKPVTVAPESIELHIMPLAGRDWILITLATVALIGVCI